MSLRLMSIITFILKMEKVLIITISCPFLDDGNYAKGKNKLKWLKVRYYGIHMLRSFKDQTRK